MANPELSIRFTADGSLAISGLKQVEKSLEAVGGAAAVAAEKTASMGAGVASGLQKAEASAKQLQAATRNLPAQFTDIFVSLQGGQSPMTVLFQQGGQLKDMFGGVWAAARAMGGYVVGLINPITLLGGAAAALGVAMYQASKEQQALSDAIALTGNAAGVSVDQLNAMASQMSAGFGNTSGAASDALAAMVNTGRVGAASLERYAETAMLVEQKFGISIEKTAEHFAELGKDPVGASKKLNESMNYLTASTYEQIRAAMEMGDKVKAAAIAQQAYDAALNVSAANAYENLGYVERAWRGILAGVAGAWKAMKEVWDWIKGVGREDPLSSQLASAQARLKDRQESLAQYGNRGVFGSSTKDQIAAEQAKIDKLTEQIRLQKQAADASASRTAAEKAGIDAVDKKFKDQEESSRKAQSAADSAAKAQQKQVEDGVKLYSDLFAKESGLAANFQEDWNKLSAAYKAGKLSTEELTQAQAALLAQQPYMVKARDAEAKLLKQIADEQAKTIEGAWRQVGAIQTQIDNQNRANATFGLGKSAVAELTLAEYESQMASLQATENVIPGYIDALQARIDKQRELIKSMKEGETLEASDKAAKKYAEDWRRTAEDINRSLTDSLMRGFEAGKGFAENLRDSIVNLFKTMVLRPVVQFVVGGALGALGLGPGTAMAGTGELLSQAGQFMDIGSTISKVYSSITGSFSAVGTAVSNSALEIGSWLVRNTEGALAEAGGSLMSSAGGLGTFSSYAAGGLAGYGIGKAISGNYSTALGKGTLELGGTALGAIFGGPLGAAIGGAVGGLINRAFGMGDTELTGQGLRGTFSAGSGARLSSYSNYHQDGGWFSSDSNWTSYSAISADLSSYLNTAITSTSASTRAYAQAIGLSADAVNSYTKSIDISLTGLDAAGREKVLTDALNSFGEDLARQALGAAGVALQRGGESASAALTRLASSLLGVNEVLKALGQASLQASLVGSDAASRLIDAFGSLDAYSQSASAYYQAYYSEAERTAMAGKTLTQQLAALGLAMPSSREAFRALVESQNLYTESGRNAYVALLKIAPAFDDLQKSLDATAQSASKLSEQASSLKEQFVSAAAELFSSLNSAIASVRTGVSEASTAVAGGPDVMSAEAIRSGIKSASLNAPDASAVISTRNSLTSAYAATDIARQALAAAQVAKGSLQLQAAAAAQERAGYASSSWGIYTPSEGNSVLDSLDSLIASINASLSAVNTQVSDASAMVDQKQAIQNAAEAAAAAAQEAYSQSLRDYVLDASRAVDKLGKLRDETLKYYQAQADLANLMTGSAASLRSAVQAARSGQLSAAENLQMRQRDFATAYSLARSTTGAVQAGYADKLTALLPGLAESIKDTAATRADWVRATAALYSQSNTVADLLQANAPKDYQAESLAMLNQIDGTLAAIEEASGSAEKVITDAIYATGSSNLDGLRAVIAAIQGKTVPAFAAGGLHAGGIRLVGERGPELEVTGPSRIFNASQTRSLLAGSGGDVVGELRALRESLDGLRAEARSTAISSDKTARFLDRVTQGGDALYTQQVNA